MLQSQGRDLPEEEGAVWSSGGRLRGYKRRVPVPLWQNHSGYAGDPTDFVPEVWGKKVHHWHYIAPPGRVPELRDQGGQLTTGGSHGRVTGTNVPGLCLPRTTSTWILCLGWPSPLSEGKRDVCYVSEGHTKA